MAISNASLIARNTDGIPVITGANTKVVELVTSVQAWGGTPEELHEELPHLSVAQIEAALAFYEEHKDEIDRDMERRLARVERFQAEQRERQPRPPSAILPPPCSDA